MALNPIGNLTYINQASSATSAIQANNMPHPSTLNHNIFYEQMQRAEEVRPTEQSHKLEDREGNGKREFDKDKKEQGDDSDSFEKAMSLDDKSYSNALYVEDRVVTEDTMLMKLDYHLLDIKG